MVTVKVEIPGYVAEWLLRRYGNAWGVVSFPPCSDMYVLLYDLMRKRPKDQPLDYGNIRMRLPDRRSANVAGGKSPEQYNWISRAGVRELNHRLRLSFWAEVHEFIDSERHINGNRYKDAADLFIRKYAIRSISREGILKNYNRWRAKTRCHSSSDAIKKR